MNLTQTNCAVDKITSHVWMDKVDPAVLALILLEGNIYLSLGIKVRQAS